MLDNLRKLFYPPTFTDEDENRKARVLNIILASLFWATIIAISATYLIEVAQDPAAATAPEQLFTLVVGIIMVLALSGLRYMMYRGQLDRAGWLLSGLLLLSLFSVNLQFNGLRDNTIVAYALVIAIPTILIRERKAVVFFTSASLLTLLLLYAAEIQGVIVYQPQPIGLIDILIYCIVFGLLGVMLAYSTQSLNEALDRARASESAASQANAQLKTFNEDLENMVASRTQALVTSADIGRSISTILDQDTLVNAVADQVREAFDYYQVHVYLLDESGDTLKLAAGSGVAGDELVAKNHFVPVSKGLVGRTVRRNTPILEPNVQEAPEWLPNPLLPNTQSEATVPISIGDKVLGVLDIQQNQLNGLDQSDIGLLESISGQVAIALQNARLLLEAQERARQETLINEISQQIQGATTIERALQIAAREVGRAVNAPETRVRLGSGPRKLSDEKTNGSSGNGEK